MTSDVASAEKLDTLRAVAGSKIPDVRLRAALIRAGGNLDVAASYLLEDGTLGQQDAPILVAVESQSNVQKPSPRREAGVLESRQSEQKPPPQQLSAADVKRQAWRRFYKNNYGKAIAAVGSDKGAINAFITNLWKSLGSKKRQDFSQAIKEELEAQRANGEKADAAATNALVAAHDPPVAIAGEGKGGTDSSPVTPVAAEPSSGAVGSGKRSNNSDPILPNGNTTGVLPPLTPPPKRMRFEPSAEVGNKLETARSGSEERIEALVGGEVWPRKITSRLCRGNMLVSGKKELFVHDEVVLEAARCPPSGKNKGKGKRGPGLCANSSKLVRFSKNGREIGRLASDIGSTLAPALQSGYVVTRCKVIDAPKVATMFAEVFLEVTIMLTKEAFEGRAEQEAAELGVAVGGNGGKDEALSGGQGVDTKRFNVVNLISSMQICEPPDKPIVDFPVSRSQGDDAGAVTEEDAEAYYKTVSDIDMNEANSFTPPEHLSCTLREYQRAGVGWMVSRERYGSLAQAKDPSTVDAMLNPLWKRRVFPDGDVFFMNPTTGGLSLDPPIASKGGPYGGILADEMGLGKTVQCIACIVHDMESQIAANAKKGSTATNMDAPVSEAKRKKMRKEGEKDTDKQNKTGKQESVPVDVGADDEITPVGSKRNNKTIPSCKNEESDAKGGHDEVANQSLRRSKRQKSTKTETREYKDVEEEKDNSEVTKSEDMDEEWGGQHSGGEKSKTHGVDDKSSDDEWFEHTRNWKRRKAQATRPQSAFAKLMSAANAGNEDAGGTLIVCPTSLVTQWMNELDLHVAPNFLRTVTHYGQSRGNAVSISLQSADVVVTTYGILASECPDESTEDDDSAGTAGTGGPLFQLNWRRVILDEAHTIKNRTTKWARAAFRLKAEKNWCVTGTVIHNNISDCYPLIHFLQVEPWSSWAFWNRGIVANIESKDVASQKMAMSLVRDIISSITLRRKKSTKDSQGNCIVHLPKKTVEIVRLTPSVEERDFYSALHERSKVQFDTYMRQGKVMNNYASVLELLLRLRQACDHPYLVFAAAPSKDSVVMKDKDKLFKQFLGAGSSSQFVEKMLNDAESGALQGSMTCPLCLDAIDDAVAPKECGHPACRTCLMESLLHSRKCPVCRVAISPSNVATLPRATRFSVDLEKKWRSSAKIDALLEDVRAIEARRRQNGGQAVGKSVVFSQFTSMLDLVGMALSKSKMKTMRIDGSVPQAQRAAILERFEKENELDGGTANILLVSLRAGGVGLNLVAAAHAILLDIHWNPQVDAQAQDRVHRHGQIRDVVVKRYIVKDSVEERLLQVQDRKRDIADGALGVATDEDKKQARISELKLLFGE